MATCSTFPQSASTVRNHQCRQPAGSPGHLSTRRQRAFQAVAHVQVTFNRRNTRSRSWSRVAIVAEAQQSADVDAQADIIEVTLPTEEAQQTIKFALTRMGKGRAVLINRLAGGSAAAEAGVRPGQRLMQISDPIRANEMWKLNDRPSIGFVRDALAMRRSETITLVVSRQSVFEPGASTSSVASMDADSEPISSSERLADEQPDEQSIGDKLAQEWQQDQQSGGQQQSDFERRQRRRKEYFERESARDDGSFVLTAAAVFLLPALAILAVAFFSGYLDRLSDSYMTTR